jgi:hypothetical protein
VSAIVFDGIPEGDVIEKKLYVEVSGLKKYLKENFQ